MKARKVVCFILIGLLALCATPVSAGDQAQPSYVGEFCFDMVNPQTIFYDLNVKLTGLLRLTVFSTPSGIYTVNGSLALAPPGGSVIPLVGTAVSTNLGLGVSFTGSTGFYDIPSVDFHTNIVPGRETPFEFFGLAHRYIIFGNIVPPPPDNLKEIGHQPIAGTLTPRECP
jgi:hypothetical protein